MSAGCVAPSQRMGEESTDATGGARMNKLEDLSPEHQAQARAQLGVKTATERAQDHYAANPSKADIKLEKELQQTCENWLTLRGYLRMTADNAVRHAKEMDPAMRGWFGHWTENKRNPLMPDLAIFDRVSLCLLVELKVRDKWQVGQKAMVETGFWRVAWNFKEFEQMVKEWEA